MYAEDDLVAISALQHWLFCRRQCALIHLEQAWSENQLTAHGRLVHDRAHDGQAETRGDVRIVRGLRLCSYAMGLTGQADVVELRRPAPDAPADQQAQIPSLPGLWIPTPVEYKRGKPKQIDCDRVQLCAQAMCLEEMVNVRITEGCLFYARPRRREIVPLDERLRRLTRQVALDVHEMIQTAQTPPAVYTPACRSCSLMAACMPRRTRKGSLYIQRQIKATLESGDGGVDANEDL